MHLLIFTHWIADAHEQPGALEPFEMVMQIRIAAWRDRVHYCCLSFASDLERPPIL
jgi:hypothetical protein